MCTRMLLCTDNTCWPPYPLPRLGGALAFPHWSVEAKQKSTLSTPSLAACGHGGRHCMFTEEERDCKVSSLPSLSLATHPWLTLPHKTASIQPLCFSMAAWFPQKLLPETNKVWFDLCRGAPQTLARLMHAIFFLLVCSGLLQPACGVKRLESAARLHALNSMNTSYVYIYGIWHVPLSRVMYKSDFEVSEINHMEEKIKQEKSEEEGPHLPFEDSQWFCSEAKANGRILLMLQTRNWHQRVKLAMSEEKDSLSMVTPMLWAVVKEASSTSTPRIPIFIYNIWSFFVFIFVLFWGLLTFDSLQVELGMTNDYEKEKALFTLSHIQTI